MSRRHRAILAAAIGLALLTPASARAQEPAGFSQRARTVLVVDNLVGVVNRHVSYSDAAGSGGVTITSPASEDGSTTAIGYAGGYAASQSLARIGVHRFLDGGLSLGGGLHYSTATAGGDLTWLALAPRVGWASPMTATTAIWLRAGATYERMALDAGIAKQTTWQLSPAAEALLVITPTSHFGVTIGAIAEIGVAGKESTELNFSFGSLGAPQPDDRNVRYRTLGLTMGVLADF